MALRWLPIISALEIESAGWQANSSVDIRKLIREMSIANSLWGAPRIQAYGEVFIRRLRSMGIRDRPTSPPMPLTTPLDNRLFRQNCACDESARNGIRPDGIPTLREPSREPRRELP